MNDAEKHDSDGELKLQAVVWGLEEVRFFLCGKLVNLYTDQQALEPPIKQNRAYRQYSALLMSWLDRLAHSDISIHYTARFNLNLTISLSRHPTEEASTAEDYEDKFVKIALSLSEHSKLNHKYGLKFNRFQKSIALTN